MKTMVGMDIGSSGVKLALFSGKGQKATLISFDQYDTTAEGVLSDRELYQGVHDRLQELTSGPVSVTVGLNAYEVSMKLSDYPVSKPGELSKMIAWDAKQVGGLADDVFLYDYILLPAGLGRQNPVLMAMVHERIIRERLTAVEMTGTDCQGFQPAMLSLAAAAFDLVDGLQDEQEPAILLDVGKENTTLVVVAGGQVLHAGSLMFGAGQWLDIGREQMKRLHTPSADDDLLEYLQTINLANESNRSELLRSAMKLEQEIQASLELWRGQEPTALAHTPITHAYVTGGGSHLGGLLSWLEEKLDCKVSPFAPRNGGVPAPELTIAYGLGLQATRKSNLNMCLLPEDVKNVRLRLARWPFLALAAALVIGSMLVGSLLTVFSHHAHAATLAKEKETLSALVSQASQLSDKQASVETLKQRVQWLAEDGQRGRNALDSLRLMRQGDMPRGWVIYLGDGQTARTASTFFAAQPNNKEMSFEGKATIPQVKLDSRKETGPFVCAGYVPEASSQDVQKLIAHLNSGSPGNCLFAGVDRGDSIENSPSAGQLVWQWRAFLNRNAKRLGNVLNLPAGEAGTFCQNFEFFTLTLPFSQAGQDEGKH